MAQHTSANPVAPGKDSGTKVESVETELGVFLKTTVPEVNPPADPRIIGPMLVEDVRRKHGEPEATHFGPPANESATAVDCMTSFENYFPELKPQTKHMLRAMSFYDRALLCSTTIERNEIYHENFGRLQADESTLIKDLLAGQNMQYNKMEEIVEQIFLALHHDPKIQKHVSRLVTLRIRRHVLEALMESIEKPNLAATTPEPTSPLINRREPTKPLTEPHEQPSMSPVGHPEPRQQASMSRQSLGHPKPCQQASISRQSLGHPEPREEPSMSRQSVGHPDPREQPSISRQSHGHHRPGYERIQSLRDPRQSPSSKRKSPGNYFERLHEPKRRLPDPQEQSPSRSLAHSSQQSQGNRTSRGEDHSLIYHIL
ncbi:hypothetical protein PCANC_10743 [Puccinia coronata f. sp. avenae]|uniref:Uncharacterized protein n=1 Tax=Puccinia coronata f. sp. avenae TaxID=200324 RepID=A0A2N5VSR9_9BASI|nr:hypothetical protein PCANC_10743 [Puccinia coronata f. sp. avenae]